MFQLFAEIPRDLGTPPDKFYDNRLAPPGGTPTKPTNKWRAAPPEVGALYEGGYDPNAEKAASLLAPTAQVELIWLCMRSFPCRS
jgi:hypothetical protein